MRKVDNLIIGAGPGGYELAAELSARGESVVVAERAELGGTCLNRGCIPTKALCASAHAAENARNAERFGVFTGSVEVDFHKVSGRVEDVVAGLREGIGQMLGKCELLRGEAVFTGTRTVKIGDEELEADRIVIATGSKPAKLDIEGAELALTSDEALWIDHLPESMVIIGGGVIGMEFASIFSALGTKVTVIEYCREILPTIDADVAKRLRTALSRKGIEIVVGAAVQRIERSDDGTLKVSYEGKKGPAAVQAKCAVMAVGRKAVVPQGFEGELTQRGFIKVDDRMQTSIPGVYAVGDVNGLLMLAHAAYAQGRVVLHDDPSLFNPDAIPSVVFTSPEVASVGPSAASVERSGLKTKTLRRPFASNGKACADGNPEGVLKMTVDEEDGAVLAVTILGEHAADLIAEATMLVTDHVDAGKIASRYVHAHPTLSEIFVQ